MSELKLGIVGTGGIGRARHIPVFQKNPKVALVAASDVSQPALDRVREEFGIASTYTDYREMFEKEGLDAVTICTPNKFHAPVAIEALRRGIHVLCEKPMAINAEEGRAMIQAARESGKVLMIAYRYRYKAASQAAKRLIEAGELGEIYVVRVNALRRRGIPSWGTFTNRDMQGGGAMLDFGVHLLDLALWLAGHPTPIEVSGMTSQRLGTRPNVNPWGIWDHEKFQVEDHAAAFIRFEGGKGMLLEASWALNIPQSIETISMSGTEGGLDLFPLKVNKAAHGMLVDWTPSWIPGERDDEWETQMADFVNAVLEGRDPVVKPEEALQVSAIVDALYKSSDTAASVKLA